MKSLLQSLVLGCVLLLLAPLVSFSQVVEDDAVLFSPAVFGFNDYSLGLTQTTLFGSGGTSGGNGFGVFWFDIEDLGNDQFEIRHQGILENFALYSTDAGEVIDLGFVNNTTPFAANFLIADELPIGLQTLAVGESVFLGYWDDRPGLVGNSFGPDVGDNFGWLELGRSARLDGSFGQLEILGGATAIGNGIIVGTTTVPEPSTAMLIGLLGVSCLFCRRRL